MTSQTLVVARAEAELATEMIALFGSDAAPQAKARAERSRNLGNAVRFCTWRQTERLISLMSAEAVQGTIH